MSTSEALRRAAHLLFAEGELTDNEKQFIEMVSAWPGAGVEATSLVYTSRLLEKALRRHAEALIMAANASDRYARRLVWATWALVAATAALVVTTIVSILT